MLKPSELLINIQLDEIYVKPNLQYTANRIVGNNENKEQGASRIQCFMISRITSKHKDVFSLTSVQNMSYVELSKLTLHGDHGRSVLVAIPARQQDRFT